MAELTTDQKIDYLWDRSLSRYVDVYRVGLGDDLHRLRWAGLHARAAGISRGRYVRRHLARTLRLTLTRRSHRGVWQAEPAAWATPVLWPRAPRGLTERSCRRRALRMYARALAEASRADT